MRVATPAVRMAESQAAPASREAFKDNFLDDMGPMLRAAYREWLPFCRDTVLAFVEGFAGNSGPGSIRQLGRAVPVTWQPTLDTVFLAPLRSYMSRSGKFLRPFLVCQLLLGYGRSPRRNRTPVALAEMIHSSSLMLDDIVDDSKLRRGGPTAHTRIGIRTSGTVASAWLNAAFEVLPALPGEMSEADVSRLLGEVAWEHWVTGIGTVIDCTWPTLASFRHAPEEYLQSVVHRSTSYTYRLPLKIGAIAGGAPAGDVTHLARFGEELGISFQLVDDILNLKPGDDHWGKTVAEDLTEGKITLQVLLALQRADSRQAARLVEILRARTDDCRLLEEAVSIIDGSGAFQRARAIAVTHVDRTHGLVRGMTFLPDETRRVLEDFVDYVVERSR